MKIAIIGAGAAGCFAAANIPFREGQEITVFEKTGRAMQKVKVSGGGRCNVTHACFDIPELSEHYPRGKQLLRKTLHRFNPSDTISWFGDRGLEIVAEADGRMFPVTNESQSVIDTIWQEMMRRQVKVQFHKTVSRIVPANPGFTIHFADKSRYEADKILIATGGYPRTDQYEWLQEAGLKIQDPVPSLFTFNTPGNPITALMGLAAEVSVKIAGTKFTESGPLLITHWGFSGPAVLRCSAWAARTLHDKQYHFTLLINWLKETKDADLKEQIHYLRREEGRQLLQHKNPFGLPRRLWEYLLVRAGIVTDTRWGELPAAQQNRLTEILLRDTYEIKGKTTFKEEFVTCGGVVLPDIDPQTMESRCVPGLYLAGEATDVDGITGGFNFQNAWTSAWIAAQAMSINS